MKPLFLIPLLVISLSSFGQTDHKTFYESGKVQSERKFDKSCNCERVTEYFESGKVRSTQTYLSTGPGNSQLDGENIFYFENGTIQIYNFWRDGSPSGRIYCNFSDGKLAYEKFFADKFKTGTWKIYNQDGTLMKELIFADKNTPWNSNDDYATEKLYFNNKLAYTIELVAGKKTNYTLVDKEGYDKLISFEQPTGQELFRQNCTSCHGAYADIVGPMMKGVTDKRTNPWLTQMIINGDSLMNSGDKEAIELYKKWNDRQHPNFERLSNEEVKAIIDYLKALK